MKIKSLLLIPLIVLLTGCPPTPQSHNGEYQNIGIQFLLNSKLSNNKKIPNDIITSIKPIILKDCGDTAFIGYDGQLHFIRFDLDSSNRIIDLKGKEPSFQLNLYGGVSPEKMSQNIDGYFSEVDLPLELTKQGTITDSNILMLKVQNYILQNKETATFIYDKKSFDNSYMGIQVFKNIDSLKNTIGLLACKSDVKNFLIICGLPNGTGEPPMNNFIELQQILMKIVTGSYEDRTKVKDDALRMYFADKFSVTVKHENPSSKIDIVENMDGAEYMNKLLGELHIVNIEITNCMKDNDRITHIDVKETRKKDIDAE